MRKCDGNLGLCEYFSEVSAYIKAVQKTTIGSDSYLNQLFVMLLYMTMYTKRTKVFVHVQTVPYVRNMHATYVISTEDNFKSFKISKHRAKLIVKYI